MSDREMYRIKVTGPGLELERQVPREVGDRVVVLVLTGAAREEASLAPAEERGPAEPAAEPLLAPIDAPPAIREFLIDRSARRNPDKIAAIGCYLSLYQGKGSFSERDLETMFSTAAEPVPKNLPRDLRWAIHAGWVAAVPDKEGHYYVTNPGITAVEQRFPKEVVARTRLQSRGKRARG